MTLKTTIQFATIIGVLFITALIITFSFGSQKAGATAGFLPATIANASSTLKLVSGTQGIIMATSSCTARIISTASSTLMLTFTDLNSAGAVPTVSNGVWQGASTTKEYDSGQYGCGAVRALSTNGSGQITIIDAQ